MVHEIQPFWLLQNPMGIPMTFLVHCTPQMPFLVPKNLFGSLGVIGNKTRNKLENAVNQKGSNYKYIYLFSP